MAYSSIWCTSFFILSRSWSLKTITCSLNKSYIQRSPFYLNRSSLIKWVPLLCTALILAVFQWGLWLNFPFLRAFRHDQISLLEWSLSLYTKLTSSLRIFPICFSTVTDNTYIVQLDRYFSLQFPLRFRLPDGQLSIYKILLPFSRCRK